MFVLRNHPKGARFASFGIGLCIFALMPRETGYQDIASLLARQPGVAERWQKQVFSAASSIQLATYSFARPIGTSVPQSAMVRLASLDGRDITGTVTRNPTLQAPTRYQASDFPKVDRSMKGDRLATVAPTQAPETAAPSVAPAQPDPATSNSSVFGAKTVALPQAMSPESAAALDPELAEALRAPPLPQYSSAPRASDIARSLAVQPLEALKRAAAPAAPPRDPFSVKTSNLFFGSSSLGGSLESIESWQPGAEPLIVMPDPDMKVTASLTPPSEDIAKDIESGESVAPKGEVNADNQRARSPAERLALDDKSRAKSEKCLAEAVYFEARGEAVRGQIAVAQVVMNRVFSGKYPDTVCGAVYQNKHRHLACQFTLRLRQQCRRDPRARDVGARQEDFEGDARRPDLAARSRQVHPLPRLLGASVLGRRDEEDVQDRRPHLLPAAQLGRRQRGTELGHAGADRRALRPSSPRKPGAPPRWA